MVERNTEAIKLAIKHYWRQVLSDWRVSLPALLLPGIGSIFVFYVPPLIVAQVLGLFGREATVTTQDLFPYIALFAGMWVLGEALWRVAIYFLILAEERGARRLYFRAMDELFGKDIAFFHDNFAGSLTKQVIGYAKGYQGLLQTFVFSVVSSIVPLFFVIAVLWQFSVYLVATLLVMLALTSVIIIPFIRRRRRLVTLREAAASATAGHIADTIGNMGMVKAFAHEAAERETYREHVEDLIQKEKRAWMYHNTRVDLIASPLYVLTNVLGLVVAFGLGQGQALNIQAVFLTFSYYATFTRIIWQFNQIYRGIEGALTEAAQFTERLLEEPKIADPLAPRSFSVTAGAITFRDVSFRYEDTTGEHLFRRFNLTIKKGEKVALVGHSGSGKSTITWLLLRFMDVDHGQVLIDGQNIAHVRQADLRAAIAYVPQEPAMFHRSVRENIRYGKPDAPDSAVQKAAKLAYAHEFITKLPKGYDSLVGERGVKLSGGQRQRVAVARALLKNAPILVLDEATSALDSESEVLIQKALWKLMQGRTTIVIAHRLSTIQKMDRIIVLEEGRIVEEGSHKELLKKGGTYAMLWKHQSGGFLEE